MPFTRSSYPGVIHSTRYPELGYTHVSGAGFRPFWRFINLTDAESVGATGREYPSKAELLSDLERFAGEFGCDGATRPAPSSAPTSARMLGMLEELYAGEDETLKDALENVEDGEQGIAESVSDTPAPSSAPAPAFVPPNLNHLQVSRIADTIFIPLPVALWRPSGICHCEHCKGLPAFWDTLALAEHPSKEEKRYRDYTFTVHYPALHRATDYEKARAAL